MRAQRGRKNGSQNTTSGGKACLGGVVAIQTGEGESLIVLSVTRLVIYSEIRRLPPPPPTAHFPLLLGSSIDRISTTSTKPAAAFYVDCIGTGRHNSN